MSIAQFSKLVQEHIYKKWLDTILVESINSTFHEKAELELITNKISLSTLGISSIKEVLNILSTQDIPAEQLAELSKYIDAYIEDLEKENVVADIVNQVNTAVYTASYYKSSSKLNIEFNIVRDNDPKLSKSAKAYVDKVFDKAVAVILTHIKTPEVLNVFITSKTQPSLIDLVSEDLLSSISGRKKSNSVYNFDSIPIKSTKLNISGPISKSLQYAKTVKQKIDKKKSQLRTKSGKFTSPTQLILLINRNLHDQIKKNMGVGNSRDILNYRTGRFAKSAEVQRITRSKEDMLTIFYTYMKYPYATFSAGGEQQSPKSRDPKLLIAKSIREIAGTSVANRMRAVNI